MFFQVNLLSVLAFAIAKPLDEQLALKTELAVVGGHDVTIEEVPYQVHIDLPDARMCGGIMLSEEWVLTAGHCMKYPADNYTIRAGANTMSSGGSLHSIQEIHIHEKYGRNTYHTLVNDLAVLKVSPPFKLDETRQPIKIFKQGEESKPGSNATLTGWGSLQEGGLISEILQKVDVPIISQKACDKIYIEIHGPLPVGQICTADPEGGKGFCNGDSGGPLAIDGRLNGIVSWSRGCARAEYPSVYMEVAHYSDWIVSKTGITV